MLMGEKEALRHQQKLYAGIREVGTDVDSHIEHLKQNLRSKMPIQFYLTAFECSNVKVVAPGRKIKGKWDRDVD